MVNSGYKVNTSSIIKSHLLPIAKAAIEKNEDEFFESLKSELSSCSDRILEKVAEEAARKGKIDILKYLFELPASKRFRHDLIMQRAVDEKQIDVINYLLEKSQLTKDALLRLMRSAVQNGHVEVIELLLEKEAIKKAFKKPDFENIAELAAGHNRIGVLELLFKKQTFESEDFKKFARRAGQRRQFAVREFLEKQRLIEGSKLLNFLAIPAEHPTENTFSASPENSANYQKNDLSKTEKSKNGITISLEGNSPAGTAVNPLEVVDPDQTVPKKSKTKRKRTDLENGFENGSNKRRKTG